MGVNCVLRSCFGGSLSIERGGGGRSDGRRAGVTPPTTRKTKRVVKFKGIWYNIHKIISLTASR